MLAEWSDVKSVLTNRNLSAQYTIIGTNYWIKAIDGAFEIDCVLPTDTSLSSDSLDFVTNFKPNGNKSIISNTSIQNQPPFGAKTLVVAGVTKSLYKRTTGIQAAVYAATPTTILFTVSYAWAKITGASIVGGEALDTVSLYVLDTTTGAYTLAMMGTAVPNYQLNQFGYNVNVAANYFVNTSPYDADIYIGMQIKMVYTSKSDKTIGINIDLHEVK